VNKTVLAYLPLLLWAAGVLFVGSLELGGTELPAGADKAAHFVTYGIGGGLAAWARHWSGRGSPWAGLAIVAAVGGVDELVQRTIPTRQSDVWDWVADVAGAAAFYFLTHRLLGRKRSA
jgi:VanZ family protein